MSLCSRQHVVKNAFRPDKVFLLRVINSLSIQKTTGWVGVGGGASSCSLIVQNKLLFIWKKCGERENHLIYKSSFIWCCSWWLKRSVIIEGDRSSDHINSRVNAFSAPKLSCKNITLLLIWMDVSLQYGSAKASLLMTDSLSINRIFYPIYL